MLTPIVTVKFAIRATKQPQKVDVAATANPIKVDDG